MSPGAGCCVEPVLAFDSLHVMHPGIARVRQVNEHPDNPVAVFLPDHHELIGPAIHDQRGLGSRRQRYAGIESRDRPGVGIVHGRGVVHRRDRGREVGAGLDALHQQFHALGAALAEHDQVTLGRRKDGRACQGSGQRQRCSCLRPRY
jgi:hypothetical protein